MFFSAKRLKMLVEKASEEGSLDEDSIHDLLYHLAFPGDNVPLIIAEILIAEPELLNSQAIIGKKLAYGHASELSELRDIEQRATQQIRLGRQINRLAISLSENKAPSNILQGFRSLTKRYIASIFFFDERRHSDRFAFAAEEVLLIENALTAIETSKTLSLNLFTQLFEKLSPAKKAMVANSLLQRLQIASALSETKEEAFSIITPQSTLPFSQEIYNNPNFAALSKTLRLFLERWGSVKKALH